MRQITLLFSTEDFSKRRNMCAFNYLSTFIPFNLLRVTSGTINANLKSTIETLNFVYALPRRLVFVLIVLFGWYS